MHTKTFRLVFIALMAAFISVTALIVIPIGTVPFSMAFFGIMVAGAMLPPLPAVVAVTIYIGLGVAGLPLFSGFQGGPQVVVGPTGGYIVGYYILVVCVSLAVRATNNIVLQMLGAIGGIVGCYTLGTLWFMYLTANSFWASVTMCVIPFVIPDLGKAVLALLLARAVNKRLNARGARA